MLIKRLPIPLANYLTIRIGGIITHLFVLATWNEVIRDQLKVNRNPIQVVFAGIARCLEKWIAYI